MEKTGVVVTGFVVFLLLLIAVLRINKRNMKTVLLLCMEVVILFSSAWGLCFYINAPIAQKTKNVVASGSVYWRIKMIKESQKIIKDNKKIGVGTGGYRQVLIDRSWDYLGFKNRNIPNKPHPHNEWLLWLIQWGVFGLLGLVLWFGYNFVYFLKGFRLFLFRKTEMFYRLLGVLLNVGVIIAGGCEAIFFRTNPFTFYLMVVCGCIARVYTLHKPEIR